MIIKTVKIEKFRAFQDVSFDLGKRITAIAGRNATQKTTVLGMIGQPFSITNNHPMYGCKTVDGYNFRSQFNEKFKISETHDIIGEHKWRLDFHNSVNESGYFSVTSIPRKQRGKKTTLRFWNAESKGVGSGYIQRPVYFLSLGRIFPIGEYGKTRSVELELTADENDYCIKNYCNILCIQNISGTPTVGLEKVSSAKSFSGVSDGTHDIFTNSAGEGNITKIILAVLSFKRLKEQYGNNYKGGILLIDELDATLYGYSQKRLVDYLWESAKKYDIQIIFTTHSPIILKQVNKYHRKELEENSKNRPFYSYDSSIIYLEPEYDDGGNRRIMPKNISSTNDLNVILNDINLTVRTNISKLNIYCEDKRAIAFVKYILSNTLKINLDHYMNFVDIDLGWTNYVQLYEKRVPEFSNNMVLLDGDVPQKPEYRSRKKIISQAENFLFLPLVSEKDLFTLLKNNATFNKFKESYCTVTSLKFDICFRDWTSNPEQYKTADFKKWFEYLEEILGDQEILYSFWCEEHPEECNEFIGKFINVFNLLADRKEIDPLPIHYPPEESEEQK